MVDLRDSQMRTDGPVVVPVWYECLSLSHAQVYQHLKHNSVETVIYACVNALVDVCGCVQQKWCFQMPHLPYLGSSHGWWYWRCCCCPPATCCRWRSLACVASRQTTDSPGECTEEWPRDTRARLSALRMRLEHGECAHHACVVVLCGLRLVLLHHTG